jgi:serine/threonine protein kinase
VSTLAIAQEHKFAHGDIKPDNFLLTASGDWRISDFKACRVITGEVQDTCPVGSEHYLSYKLTEAASCAKVEHNLAKSDMVSLGLTILAMA